jgi:hypothetical protein
MIAEPRSESWQSGSGEATALATTVNNRRAAERELAERERGGYGLGHDGE